MDSPATFGTAEEMEGRLSVECAALDVQTYRFISGLNLPADGAKWTTAFCTQIIWQNNERRRRMESVLPVWRNLVEVSTRGLEADAYEVLRASLSAATGLAQDIRTLWTEFSVNYDRVLFRMDMDEVLVIEGARTTFQDAMESVNNNERDLTTKMDEWAPYFASMLTVDGLDIAINSVKERTQTDLSTFVDVAAPHFDRLHKLAYDRRRMSERMTEEITRTEGRELAGWLEELGSQKDAVKRAIASLQHVTHTMNTLTSSFTGSDGRDVPVTRISEVLTAYDEVRIMAKEVYEMGRPLWEALRVIVKRMRKAMRNVPAPAPPVTVV